MKTDETQNGATDQKLDLEAVREQLAGQSGQRYWRSLEELSDSPQFQKWVEDEFPNRSSLLQINRRDMLKFMGASMALAGLTGCRGVYLPQEKIVPYVKQPEELVPGKPLFYASTLTLGGYGHGVLVEQHEGRPIRIEGNPEHPESNGNADALIQAQVLSLYDPDRAANVIQQGDISTWELFNADARKAIASQAAAGGAGIRILTGAVTSPTLADQIGQFLTRNPAARWHRYEPVDRGFTHAGATLAYGRPVDTIYNFAAARTVVSLDADFLSPVRIQGDLRYARDFVNGRRVHGTSGTMNRLYAFESEPTLTGMMADHRWPVKSSVIHGIALALAAAVGVPGAAEAEQPINPTHFAAMVADLTGAPGTSIVIAGEHQPAEVHALVHLINQQLGNVGRTVVHIPPVDASVGRAGDLRTLVDDMNAGRVSMVLVVGGNPVYDAPSDLRFAEALAKVRTKIHLSLENNETGALCDWQLPMAHELEQWGDARAFDGTVSIMQPLISPLFEGRSALEVFAQLNDRPLSGYDLVKGFWRRRRLPGADFELAWRNFVHDGVLKGSALKPVAVTATAGAAALAAPRPVPDFEVNFRPDPSIYDGRFANNGWLQELPKPITKMTWDNVAQMSPATARALNFENEDVITITRNGRSVQAAVFVQPGQAANTVVLNLGYGRTKGGTVATVKGDEGGGFDAYQLRTSDSMFIGGGIEMRKANAQNGLATTQAHSPLGNDRINDNRDVIREASLAAFNEDNRAIVPKFAVKEKFIAENNLYVEEVFQTELPQWGMTIDMNTCIGCNACVIACQSENNIPVVGKTQVNRNREMHWLRIDRYYQGKDDNPTVAWQPMMCVHCEKAPCEPVCPVAATVHSHDGLNQMVYNRCVGTRYCSNNCPYKVRRFNYLNYSDNQPNWSTKIEAIAKAGGNTTEQKNNGMQLLSMMNNPDVTVRGRGVMEKCTYCVQRINDARREAKKQGREIRDGEIITACQQACPTQTIVFGNIADKDSAVSRLRRDPRSYLLLAELQTRPRTSYLAKLRNPNPAIQPEQVG
jgi:molybdopterin-containing oxidoreductase family iron-sulfur binding subunit